MTQPVPLPRRCLLRLLAAGLGLAALPLGGERPWEAPRAWAGDNDDNSGPGRGGDDRDEDDRDEDDDREDDDRDDEDNSGPGGGDDEDEREDRAATAGRGRDGSDRGLRDITVLYPDGWTERIVDGRYELLDHQSRLVVRRAATRQDFGRMIALRCGSRTSLVRPGRFLPRRRGPR